MLRPSVAQGQAGSRAGAAKSCCACGSKARGACSILVTVSGMPPAFARSGGGGGGSPLQHCDSGYGTHTSPSPLLPPATFAGVPWGRRAGAAAALAAAAAAAAVAAARNWDALDAVLCLLSRRSSDAACHDLCRWHGYKVAGAGWARSSGGIGLLCHEWLGQMQQRFFLAALAAVVVAAAVAVWPDQRKEVAEIKARLETLTQVLEEQSYGQPARHLQSGDEGSETMQTLKKENKWLRNELGPPR